MHKSTKRALKMKRGLAVFTRLPDDLAERVRVVAIDLDRPLSSLAREALRLYVAAYERSARRDESQEASVSP